MYIIIMCGSIHFRIPICRSSSIKGLDQQSAVRLVAVYNTASFVVRSLERSCISNSTCKMKSSRFLERIYKRVRRSSRSRARDSRRSRLDKQTASKQDVSSRRHATENSGVPSVTPPAADCYWSLEVAAGAFQDSTLTRAAAKGPIQTTHSLPAGMESLALTSSLLRAEMPVEDSHGKDAGIVSTRAKECIPRDTSLVVVVEPEVKQEERCTRPAGVSKELCMLSATDSGLYSEEDNSEDDYLEVFSDDEEDDLGDDGWLIPADEVTLDKVVAHNKTETVYK